MCGIAGYYGPHEIPPDRVQTALSLMRRRGPDYAAHRCWKHASGRNAYLLHSRLSIIDLEERSNQPLRVSSKWIAFNGELYNYVEVRDELKKAGRSFATESDTEALLTAIDHFGWDALDKCEGMWAFAVYDENDGSLTLCRDRFAEKPLYLFRDESGFYFGSEVKFVTALLGRKLDVNFRHLYRFMVNGYRALYKQPQTFFEGLGELPSSTFLRIEADGTERQQVYWQPRFSPVDSMSYEEATKGVRERVIRSVELRLRADVPLAFCMSGGIDSNSLISVAKNVFDYDVHGFTIMNTDARYEERDVVEHAVRELGIRHTPIPVETHDFLPKLRTLIEYHDAPVFTINYFAHWLLQQSIHEHGYRISVSGTGGDELLSGYYDHHMFYLQEMNNFPELFRSSLQKWESEVKPYVRNPYLRDPFLFIGDPQFRDHLYLNADRFAEYLTLHWNEPFVESNFTDSLLRNRMMNEMFYESVPVSLHEDDLNAMYYSVENRSPMLDRNLFEFCYQIPTRHLVHDGYTKAVLRDAMRGIVPDGVLNNRRKVGFNVPIFSYLDVHDPWVRSYLLDGGRIFDHVKRGEIEALIQKPDLPNSESKFLFYFLSCKIFLELSSSGPY
ncbi:MAG: asparagine synthase (glutamine-hydrolyzing) [Thermodesulfobacteriota bacterium]